MFALKNAIVCCIFLTLNSCEPKTIGLQVEDRIRTKKESFVAVTEENFLLMKIKMQNKKKDELFTMLVDGKIELLSSGVKGTIKEIKTDRCLIEYSSNVVYQPRMAWISSDDIEKSDK